MEFPIAFGATYTRSPDPSHRSANNEKPGSPPARSLPQQLPRNHHPLNLTSPLANRTQPHITIKLLRRIVLDDPMPSMDLPPLVADSASCLTRIQLRHGRLHRHLLPFVLH